MPEDVSLPLEPSTPTPPADDGGSLADHEKAYAQHQPDERPVETPEPEPPPADAAPETEDQRDRDEQGRFKPKARHTAAKDVANREDVPRIRTLSAQLQAARAELDALKARPQGTPVSAPTSLPSAPPVALQPEPDINAYMARETDFTVGLAKWTKDAIAWDRAQAEQQRQEQERQRTAAAETQRLISSWDEKKAAAMAKYPDFAERALETPTKIPQGSLIDAWILEHKTGADVLYHLQTHPDELTAMLTLPLLEQAESLALLSQRLNGSSRSATVATGSAPAPPSPPLPRPPNPVRTGPMKAGDEPPGDGASLADHERYFPLRRPRG